MQLFNKTIVNYGGHYQGWQFYKKTYYELIQFGYSEEQALKLAYNMKPIKIGEYYNVDLGTRLNCKNSLKNNIVYVEAINYNQFDQTSTYFLRNELTKELISIKLFEIIMNYYLISQKEKGHKQLSIFDLLGG